MALPLVSIVGRPNVGKSTLFNRLVSQQVALVEDLPGVTRDRLMRETSWLERPFMVADTGGLAGEELGPWTAAVRQQVEAAIAESALVVMVIDARTGVLAEDQEVAELVRRTARSVLLVANKVESLKVDISDGYRLGLGEPLPVSAAHGLGVGDLLDAIISHLPEGEAPQADEASLRLAILGRPNTGKSTLLNRLLGEERSVVSTAPGTTVDPVDALFHYQNQTWVLVDTAGVRRRSRISAHLESRMVTRSLEVVERADLAVLVIEAAEGLTEQDARLAHRVIERGRGLLIALNKWDLVTEEGLSEREATDRIREELPDIPFAPVKAISAVTGWHVGRLLRTVDSMRQQLNHRVSTPDLTRLIQRLLQEDPPPAIGGKRLKIFYATQVGIRPPTFTFFCNHPQAVSQGYLRHLERRLRDEAEMADIPLRMYFRRRTGGHRDEI